jgi:spermidine synthase
VVDCIPMWNRAATIVPAFFALTLFASAALLFLVQPMVGKLVLPLLGGTPAVWNTCLVFFQVLLLAGYTYAHWTTTLLGVRRQAIVHLLLLSVPFLALPITLPSGAVPDDVAIARPAWWLIITLGQTVGLPFFMVATSGPILQRWFAATGHRDAADPYHLYAASNLGSFVALLGYPLLVEPHSTLGEQGSWWTWGYVALLALVALCALVLFISPAVERQRDGRDAPVSPPSTAGDPGILFWILLAAIPSALLVSVTSYLTTDIAAVPLLWVLPLALYLLSFVLAFARRQFIARRVLAAVLPILVLILLLAMLIDATEPIWLLLPGHLAALLVAAWVCHGELARRRPPAERLTGYYLTISLGGALGGLASALAAPLIFRSPGAEYALTLIAACALAPPVRRGPTSWHWRDVQTPLALGVVTAILVTIVNVFLPDPGRWVTGALFGVPLVAVATFMDHPARFAAGLLAIFCAGALFDGPNGRPLVTERNFFGVVRVTREPRTGWHRLVHGNTVHGRQAWIDGVPQPTPLTYYHPTGPAGQLFRTLGSRPELRIAQCGLGTGALAYYATPGQSWVFYEIDPDVVRVARDPALFTFLSDHLPDDPIVLGDARLQLRHAADSAYDIIVIDAFSSDAIPVHLLTREAVALYLQKLAAGGMLVFHISNRYLDLKPVLAGLAADAALEVCRVRDDSALNNQERDAGKSPSIWVVMSRRSEDIGQMRINALWMPVEAPPGFRVWTDDYSHLWGVFKWW